MYAGTMLAERLGGMERIGFTGTQQGLTEKQQASLIKYLTSLLPFAEFHHGDCIGADAQAAEIVRDLPCDILVVAWPCNIEPKRAYFPSDVIHPVEKPLIRNRHIVDSVDRLIVCPKGPKELRSGTWATYRYSRVEGMTISTIIRPNGNVEAEEPF